LLPKGEDGTVFELQEHVSKTLKYTRYKVYAIKNRFGRMNKEPD
jgi:hypothetical protein